VVVKRFLSSILALSFILGITSAAASTAGSAEDPLISKSYIDNTYPDVVLMAPLKRLSDSLAVLNYKLSQAKAASETGIYSVSAIPNSSISLNTGASFVLLSGSAYLASCSGTVIDVTNGSTLSAGATLTIRHRYVAAEHTTAAATVLTFASIAVYGNARISAGNAPSFIDVSEDAWYYSDVCYAVQKGLVNGRSTQTYAPDDNLSIAEAIKLASCMHQLYHNGSITLNNYTDSSLWYKTYVDYAAQNKIVTKIYQNYTSKITRSEFVSIFYASLPATEFTGINTIYSNTIPDVKSADSNATQIYAFYRAGILTGSDASGTFYPDNNIKRSEVASILTRMFEKTARKSIALS